MPAPLDLLPPACCLSPLPCSTGTAHLHTLHSHLLCCHCTLFQCTCLSCCCHTAATHCHTPAHLPFHYLSCLTPSFTSTTFHLPPPSCHRLPLHCLLQCHHLHTWDAPYHTHCCLTSSSPGFIPALRAPHSAATHLLHTAATATHCGLDRYTHACLNSCRVPPLTLRTYIRYHCLHMPAAYLRALAAYLALPALFPRHLPATLTFLLHCLPSTLRALRATPLHTTPHLTHHAAPHTTPIPGTDRLRTVLHCDASVAPNSHSSLNLYGCCL